jgi:hypothetical protein
MSYERGSQEQNATYLAGGEKKFLAGEPPPGSQSPPVGISFASHKLGERRCSPVHPPRRRTQSAEVVRRVH